MHQLTLLLFLLVVPDTWTIVHGGIYETHMQKIVTKLSTAGCTKIHAAGGNKLMNIGKKMDKDLAKTGKTIDKVEALLQAWIKDVVSIAEKSEEPKNKLYDCVIMIRCYSLEFIKAATRNMRQFDTSQSKETVVSVTAMNNINNTFFKWTNSSSCDKTTSARYEGVVQTQFNLTQRLDTESCVYNGDDAPMLITQIAYLLELKEVNFIHSSKIGNIDTLAKDIDKIWQTLLSRYASATVKCRRYLSCYRYGFKQGFKRAYQYLKLKRLTDVGYTYHENAMKIIRNEAFNSEACISPPGNINPLRDLENVSLSILQSKIAKCAYLPAANYTAAVNGLMANWKNLSKPVEADDLYEIPCVDLGNRCRMDLMVFKAKLQVSLAGLNLREMFETAVNVRAKHCRKHFGFTAEEFVQVGICNLDKSTFRTVNFTTLNAILNNQDFWESQERSNCQNKPNIWRDFVKIVKKLKNIDPKTLTCGNYSSFVNFLLSSDFGKLKNLCACGGTGTQATIFNTYTAKNDPRACRKYIDGCRLRFNSTTMFTSFDYAQCRLVLRKRDFTSPPTYGDFMQMGLRCSKNDLGGVKNEWLRKTYTKHLRPLVCKAARTTLPVITALNFLRYMHFISTMTPMYVARFFPVALLRSNLTAIVQEFDAYTTYSYNPVLSYLLSVASFPSESALCSSGYAIAGFTSAQQLNIPITNVTCVNDLIFRLRSRSRSGRQRSLARRLLSLYRRDFSGITALQKAYVFMSPREFAQMPLMLKLQYANFMAPHMSSIDFSVGRAVFSNYLQYYGGTALVTTSFSTTLGNFALYGELAHFVAINSAVRNTIISMIIKSSMVRTVVSNAVLKYLTAQYLLRIANRINITADDVPEYLVCGLNKTEIVRIATKEDCEYCMDKFSQCRIDDDFSSALVQRCRNLGTELNVENCGDYCSYLTDQEINKAGDFESALEGVAANARRRYGAQYECQLTHPNECTQDKLSVFQHRINMMRAAFARRSLGLAFSGARVKRLAGQYTCALVTLMGAGVTQMTAPEITGMSPAEFKDCVDTFGDQDFTWTTAQSVALKTQLTNAGVYGSTFATWDESDILATKCMVNVLDSADLAQLVINSTTITHAIGGCIKLNKIKAETIFERFLTLERGSNAATLTSSDLASMGTILCGMKASHAAVLNPAALSDALSRVQLAGSCLNSLATVLVSRLKAPGGLGTSVSSWTNEVVGELGPLFNGLSSTDIQNMTQAQIQAIPSTGITEILPAKLAEFTPTQFEAMGSIQITTISPTQQNALSSEQLNVVIESGATDENNRLGSGATENNRSPLWFLVFTLCLLLLQL